MKKKNRMSWVTIVTWPAIIAVVVGALIVINQIAPKKSRAAMPTSQNTPPTSTTATK